MGVRRPTLALFAICLGLAHPARAEDDASLERMQALEEQIREGKSRLDDARDRAREMARLLSASEARRADLGQRIRDAEAALRRLRNEAGTIEREIARLEKDIARRRADIRHGSAVLLSLHQGGTIEVLLQADGADARAMRAGTLRVALDGLRERMQALDADLRKLDAERRRLDANIGQQQATRARLADEQKEAEARAEQQRRTLALVRKDEALAAGVLEDLEGARAELARLIARTKSGGGALLPFAPLKGRLDPPAIGELLLGFGRQRDPVFKVDVDHPGWTVKVRKGTPAKAVAGGEVAYAGWLRGYGNLVVLRHGDEYFTLYGHLDELLVKPGDMVRESTPVGLTGDSGSMYGPALHFEIRHRREALNPKEWLTTRR